MSRRKACVEGVRFTLTMGSKGKEKKWGVANRPGRIGKTRESQTRRPGARVNSKVNSKSIKVNSKSIQSQFKVNSKNFEKHRKTQESQFEFAIPPMANRPGRVGKARESQTRRPGAKVNVNLAPPTQAFLVHGLRQKWQQGSRVFLMHGLRQKWQQGSHAQIEKCT